MVIVDEQHWLRVGLARCAGVCPSRRRPPVSMQSPDQSRRTLLQRVSNALAMNTAAKAYDGWGVDDLPAQRIAVAQPCEK